MIAGVLVVALAACQDSSTEATGPDRGEQTSSGATGGPSLPPGPPVEDDAQVAAGELVVLVDDQHPLESAARELGGRLVSYDDRIGVAVVEFDDVSRERLLSLRDELRARGFDAALSSEVEDPTTG